MGWSKAAREAAALARKAKRHSVNPNQLKLSAPRQTSNPLTKRPFTKDIGKLSNAIGVGEKSVTKHDLKGLPADHPLRIAEGFIAAAKKHPNLTKEVNFDVTRGHDKVGHFTNIDTGSTSAYEGTSARIYHHGLVTHQGDSAGIGDHLGMARGGDTAFVPPKHLKKGLHAFVQSWN